MIDLPFLLKEHQQVIREIDPDSQAIPYRYHHWASRFANDSDFGFIVDAYPHTLSRKNIADLARQALYQQDIVPIRRLFLAAMMWGYGTVGYGPYRTARMLADPHAKDILQDTFTAVSSGHLLDAYQRFRLRMCGSAFFTKYFYFIGLGAATPPQSLILDSVVATSLESHLHIPITQFARVTRNKVGKIVSVGYDPSGYINYVTQMRLWAQQLGCRPDSIELVLFALPGTQS